MTRRAKTSAPKRGSNKGRVRGARRGKAPDLRSRPSAVQLNRDRANVVAPADLVTLQQTVGNRAVNRILKRNRNGAETNSQTATINGSGGTKTISMLPARQTAHNREITQLRSSQQPSVQRDGTLAEILDTRLYERAKKNHDEDRKALHSIVDGARKQTADIRLRNSAEWVMQGHRGMKLYALTPTHDASKRLEHMFPGESDGNHSFFSFPKGAMYKKGKLQPPVYYDQDIDSARHLKPLHPNVEALEEPGVGLGIVSPSDSAKEDVERLLRHEVQHAADLSGELGSKRGTARQVLNNRLKQYKTEFRAHSFEGPDYDHLSNIKQVVKEGFTWSERQWAIFSDIKDRYEGISDAWDTDAGLDERLRFRRAVVAFKMPASVNPLNSARVDKFNHFLEGREPKEFRPLPAKPKGILRPITSLAYKIKKLKAKALYKKLLKLVRNLDAEDRRSLIINPGAQAFRREKLGLAVGRKIEAEIKKGMREGPIRSSELYQ